MHIKSTQFVATPWIRNSVEKRKTIILFPRFSDRIEENLPVHQTHDSSHVFTRRVRAKARQSATVVALCYRSDPPRDRENTTVEETTYTTKRTNIGIVQRNT